MYYYTLIYYIPYILILSIASHRSQWPRGLKCSTAAARLLRLWVSVASVVCCQVDVSETSWCLVQRSPTDCGVSLRVI